MKGPKESHKRDAPPPAAPPPVESRPESESRVDRFRRSMIVDYEKWHDGVGYDLEILKTATPEERAEIENLLISHGVSDWRDVEALAALDSQRARAALRAASRNSDHRLRIAVADYAPDLVSARERSASLVTALENAETYGGLTQALLQVESFHPPEVVEALFRGLLARSGEVAVLFAAMLMFVHGKAASAFDWEQRPFFLKFNTDDRAERAGVFRDLCVRVGADARLYLDGPETRP